jgi:hypothetical protein
MKGRQWLVFAGFAASIALGLLVFQLWPPGEEQSLSEAGPAPAPASVSDAAAHGSEVQSSAAVRQRRAPAGSEPRAAPLVGVPEAAAAILPAPAAGPTVVDRGPSAPAGSPRLVGGRLVGPGSTPNGTLPTGGKAGETGAAGQDPGEPTAHPADLEEVRYMLRDYRAMAGENPVGNNAEIMRAMMGDNRKGARLGPPESHRLNGKGELVDRWDTPYFFHQLSAQEMEIRSAGPDRMMWTADDRVTK